MSKHTPGPWHVDEHGAIRGGDLSIVATRHRLPMEVHTANANLIAAAPEMLEALKAIAEATHRRQLPITSEINDLAMAAIAKATLGGQ